MFITHLEGVRSHQCNMWRRKVGTLYSRGTDSELWAGPPDPLTVWPLTQIPVQLVFEFPVEFTTQLWSALSMPSWLPLGVRPTGRGWTQNVTTVGEEGLVSAMVARTHRMSSWTHDLFLTEANSSQSNRTVEFQFKFKISTSMVNGRTRHGWTTLIMFRSMGFPAWAWTVWPRRHLVVKETTTQTNQQPQQYNT